MIIINGKLIQNGTLYSMVIPILDMCYWTNDNTGYEAKVVSPIRGECVMLVGEIM